LVADMADSVHCQRRVGRGLVRFAVLVGNAPAADQRVHAVGFQILAGEYTDYARRRAGLGNIDAVDGCMGMGRADEAGIGLPRQDHVIQIVTVTGQKAVIFLAAYRGTDSVIAHGSSPHRFRTGVDRLDDIVVAGAAAEIAF